MGVSADEMLRRGAVAWLEWRSHQIEMPDLSAMSIIWLISTPGDTSIHKEESDGNGKNP